MPFVNDERFQIRLPGETIRRIDAWRQTERVVPGRSAAIRFLIDHALQAIEQEMSAGIAAPKSKRVASRVRK